MDVHTRGGSFGPGGYGGGIFDGSQMGFGAVPRFEQAAAGIMGLGATTGAFVWCSSSHPCATGDPRVKSLQTALNKVLSAHHMQLLVTDGKFGAKTCGAMAWLAAVPPEEWSSDPVIADAPNYMVDDTGHSVCLSYTTPTPVGSTKPVDLNKEIGITLPPAGAQWMQPNADMTGLQSGLNHDLAEHDYDPIAVTGVLDAPTCGAMKFAKDNWGMSDYFQRYGGNCQAYVTPHKTASAAPPPATKTVATTDGGGPTPLGVKKKGMTTAWVVGGLGVAAGIAALFAMKKKR
jgi:hypothetical protein